MVKGVRMGRKFLHPVFGLVALIVCFIMLDFHVVVHTLLFRFS